MAENAVNDTGIKHIWDKGMELIESTQSVSGNPVTIANAAPINAEDITVDITPQQDLHGYDRPWAGGAGKNKLPSPNSVTKSGSFTVDNNNGVITINGSVANGDYIQVDFDSTTMFSDGLFAIMNSTAFSYANISFYNGSSQLDYFTLVRANRVITVNSFSSISEKTITRYRINFLADATLNNFVVSPMLVHSGEDTTAFAQYSNICPIEVRTGAKLDRVGKNWFPLTVAGLKAINTGGTWNGNTYTLRGVTFALLTNNGENVTGINVNGTASGDARLELYTAIIQATFILNGCPSGGSSSGYKLRVANSNNTAIGEDEGSGYIFSETKEYKISINVGDGTNVQSKTFYPMLRANGTDATYEPYQGQQYTASFGETVYGGKWHVTEGGTDKTYGCVEFDGSDDEQIVIVDRGNRASLMCNGAKQPISPSAISGLLSNEFKTVSNIDTYHGRQGISQDGGRIFVSDGTGSMNLVDFKAFLSNNPLQVVYELATPTTISTPKQNVPMLQGINTVSADCGDTQLKYQPDNVIGEIKGEIEAVEAELAEAEENLKIVYEDYIANASMGIVVQNQAVGDVVYSDALDITKTGYTPIAVTDTSVVLSTVADQGKIATHCLLDATNNRVRFYVHCMDSAASVAIPPNSLTFRVAYKKA